MLTNLSRLLSTIASRTTGRTTSPNTNPPRCSASCRYLDSSSDNPCCCTSDVPLVSGFIESTSRLLASPAQPASVVMSASIAAVDRRLANRLIRSIYIYVVSMPYSDQNRFKKSYFCIIAHAPKMALYLKAALNQYGLYVFCSPTVCQPPTPFSPINNA